MHGSSKWLKIKILLQPLVNSSLGKSKQKLRIVWFCCLVGLHEWMVVGSSVPFITNHQDCPTSTGQSRYYSIASDGNFHDHLNSSAPKIVPNISACVRYVKFNWCILHCTLIICAHLSLLSAMVVFYGVRLTDDRTEKYIPTARLRAFSFITVFYRRRGNEGIQAGIFGTLTDSIEEEWV